MIYKCTDSEAKLKDQTHPGLFVYEAPAIHWEKSTSPLSIY